MTDVEDLKSKIFYNDNILEEYDDICWKTQDSNKRSILFYHFRTASEQEVDSFKQRMKTCQYKICFVNHHFDHQLKDIVYLKEKDTHLLKQYLLDLFYPLKNKLYFVGVTGTNGKTTTVELIRQMAVLEKVNVLTIGTLGVYKNDEKIKNFSLTTPSLIDLRKTLFEVQEQVDLIAMELSSIALEQGRVSGINFDAIAWTNFTQDHLDYHKNMENYFKAKMLVFNCLKTKDCIYTPSSQKELTKKINRTHKVIPVDPVRAPQAFFKLSYNNDNLGLALQLFRRATHISFTRVEELLPPPGRANIIEHGEQIIVIDYAHTPDALISIAKNLKSSFHNKDLITLFGCGGDRDRSKRSIMAKAAQGHSDHVVLTSDNPRFEDPQQIFNDAKAGLGTKSEIIPDRKVAIQQTLLKYKEAVILIAGKGHEDYLEVKGVKHHYNDMQWVKEIICD